MAEDRRRNDDGPGLSFGSRGGYGRGFDPADPDRRPRDFGDSAGYGSGGSARDWREVLGNDRPDGRHRSEARLRAEREFGSVFSPQSNHRGRGPKGYVRSDERIREDVGERLTEDPEVDASNIEVVVANREVTLSGTVGSRFEKRRAEDVADSVSGVVHVQNNLRVASAGLSAGEPGPTGAVADSMGFGTATTGMASVANNAPAPGRRGRR